MTANPVLRNSNVTHAVFTIERTYAAAPARVFAAFASPEAKARWFAGPDEWTELERAMDFREGGRERVRGRFPNGRVSDFDACYFDIVQGQRIVYGYNMHVDDQRISVSLATIELKPDGARTHLTFTEQGAYLDGYDDAGSREHGTRALLESLARSLEPVSAKA